MLSRSKYVVALFLVAGTGAGIWGCSERGPEPALLAPTHTASTSQSSVETGARQNPLAHVGVLHNLAMDNVLVCLRSAAQQKGAPLTRHETISVIEACLDEFFRQHGLGGLHPEEMQRSLSVLGARPGASGQELLSDLSALMGDVVVFSLSPRAQEYADQVIYLADQADYHRSLELLRSQLIQLEQAAASELSGTDLEAIYATSAVAISSAEYWPANAQYWAALCGTDITCYPHGGGGGPEPPLEPMANRNLTPDSHDGRSPADGAGGGTVTQMVNGWKVLGADATGALGGFLLGAWPGAAVQGAVASTIAVIMLM